VRIFIRNNETDEGDFYYQRIQEAWNRRLRLGYENCCRVVFGEADNLPALIVDKYADILAVQCLSLGIHQRKKVIVDALVKIFNPKGIYERSDVAVRAKEGLQEEKGVLYGEVPDEVIIEENGLKMSVDVKNGQKTGYFLDQKENRFSLRRYATDGCVLDCFCNSGGFSMNAAMTAKEVTAVDVSQFALDNVMKNAQLNGFTNVKTERADVFELLRQKRASGEKYDLVVLDPPAFCKSAAEAKDACAQKILEQVYAYMGEFLANICDVVDPEAVVLGGGVSKAGMPLLEGVQRHFEKYVFHAVQPVRFTLATLGNDAGAYGAFKLILDSKGE
jgi:23S rRNA (cytosine1962-C5)-methyltransferase